METVYSAGEALNIDDPLLTPAWLAEASLHARANGSTPLKDMIGNLSFFPFRIKPVQASILLLRHSDSNFFVMVWTTSSSCYVRDHKESI